MLLTQLEYFAAVARERHFGRAAQACFVSQPALSESIRKLEIELGIPLIQRGRSFQGLTQEGASVLEWTHRVLANHRALLADAASARGQLSGTVRLGVVPSAVALAGRLAGALTESHPELRVRVTTGITSAEVLRRIRAHELDVGFIHPADEDDDLEQVVRFDVGFDALAGDSALLVADGVVSLDVLRGQALCLLERGMRAREAIDEAFEGRGLAATPQMESDSVEGLIALVRHGPWVALVPHSSLDGGPPAGVTRIPVDPAQLSLPVALVQLRETPRSPYARAILAAGAAVQPVAHTEVGSAAE